MQIHPDGKSKVDLEDLLGLAKGVREKRYRPKLNLLVIDDNPLFGKMVRKLASREHIAVTECSSLDEVDAVALPGIFDVAIVDYHLDGMQRDLKGPVLARRLGSTPTILVSQHEGFAAQSDPWPENIKFYLSKGRGPQTLLKAALRCKGHNRGAP